MCVMMSFLSQNKRPGRQADNDGDENERGGGEICKEVSYHLKGENP